METNQNQNQFIDLNGFSNYEISISNPYRIRNKQTKRITSESKNKAGYYTVNLNGTTYNKHRIVAEQFIPNPMKLPCVDHINHDRADNNVSNLRWCSYADNNRNKKTNRGRIYNYREYNDKNNSLMLPFVKYLDHEFENYYIDAKTGTIYYDTGLNYRELLICSSNGKNYVNMKDKSGVNCRCPARIED